MFFLTNKQLVSSTARILKVYKRTGIHQFQKIKKIKKTSVDLYFLKKQITLEKLMIINNFRKTSKRTTLMSRNYISFFYAFFYALRMFKRPGNPYNFIWNVVVALSTLLNLDPGYFRNLSILKFK